MAQPRSGRPHKLIERDRRVLKRGNGFPWPSIVFARPLVQVKGNLNAKAYNYILDNSVLPTFWPWKPNSLLHTEMVCRDRCGRT